MTTSKDTLPPGDTCACGCVTPAPRVRHRLLADRAGFVARIWA